MDYKNVIHKNLRLNSNIVYLENDTDSNKTVPRNLIGLLFSAPSHASRVFKGSILSFQT